MDLVTGATGHIGNVLVRELLARGRAVRALILPGEDCSALQGLPIEQVEGNVLEPASLEPSFRGVEVVYHLAGVISILPGKNTIVTQVNVQGTRNILRAAKTAGVRRLIYTSSIHAITRAAHGVTIDERLPFDALNTAGEYDRSKAQASLAVLEAAQEGLDAVIVCPTGVIGPYDYRLSEMGRLLRSATGKGLKFCVDGAYDFVDVRDVARGEILAGEKGKAGEVYILSGEQIKLVRLIELAQQASGQHQSLLIFPRWLARAAAVFTPWYYRLTRSRPLFTTYSLVTVFGNSMISSAKAHRELGYRPRALLETVRDTVAWFKNH